MKNENSASSLLYRGTILGVDPGEHNGICVLDLYSSPRSDASPWPKLSGFVVKSADFFTAEGEYELIRYLDLFFSEYARGRKEIKLCITVEHFVFTRNSMYGGSRAAIEMTGVVKALRALTVPAAQLYTDQKPGDAKLISNKVLENLKIKVKGDKSDDHAHMAAKHALKMALRIKSGEVLL